MPNQINGKEFPDDDEEASTLLADPFEAFTEWASPEDEEDFKDLAGSSQPVIVVQKDT